MVIKFSRFSKLEWNPYFDRKSNYINTAKKEKRDVNF